MKCIIGLGNPGKKYSQTRHNVGFQVIDELLDRHGFTLSKEKFKGFYTMENIAGNKVLLVQPHTFMNLSGECVKPLLEYYRVPVEDILVVYDDLDLPAGKIRLREKGGHGGHNGIRSLIDHLQVKTFKRLRVGIGRPEGSMAVVDYVLGRFSKDQEEDMEHSVNIAADACEDWLERDFTEVMNTFN